MKRRSSLPKLITMFIVFSAAAQYALAGSSGPFSFSFATDFLAGVFFLPLRLAGCI